MHPLEQSTIYEWVGDTITELFVDDGVVVGTHPARDSENIHATVQFYFVNIKQAGLMNGPAVFKIARCNDQETIKLEFMGNHRVINEHDFWPGESGIEDFEFSVVGAVQDLTSHWYTTQGDH
jgi:hypothetical protein